MWQLFVFYLRALPIALLIPGNLAAENAALRAQLRAHRNRGDRPRLKGSDRRLWIWLGRTWSGWREALIIVKPETVLRWHREGFRAHWRRVCDRRPGRPPIPGPHRRLIRRLSLENPSWGEDRIALELKTKLGVVHAASTIRKYMRRPSGPGHLRRAGSTWRPFLRNHGKEIWSMDFTSHYLWNYRLQYVLVVVELHSRQVVHVGVTASPTLAWLKQQLKEATPYGLIPRFLIHDNDGRYGQFGRRSCSLDGRENHRCALDHWLYEVLGVVGIPTPYRAPNANAICERFIGSLRRECLNQLVFLSEGHLRRSTSEYVRYFNSCRVHQGIDGIPRDGPGLPRVVANRTADEPIEVVATSYLGGLHRDYRLAA